jgi:hypothetical protein
MPGNYTSFWGKRQKPEKGIFGGFGKKAIGKRYGRGKKEKKI